MKQKLVISLLLLTLALLVISCTTDLPEENTQAGSGQGAVAEPASETGQYIEGQFVDENESIEIGELI